MDNFQGKVLNRQVMSDLVGDDMALIRKFQLDFIVQAEQSLIKLENAFHCADYMAITAQSHYLKTSSKALGAEQISELLELLEIVANDQNLTVCGRYILHLKTQLNQLGGVINNEQQSTN